MTYKVLALRADAGGCAFYRIQEPARVLQDSGWDIEIAQDLPVEATQDGKTGEIDIQDIAWEGDLIVFQRPLNHAFYKAIQVAQSRGIKCIVELDDDFETISAANVAHANVQPHSNPLENRLWLRRACSVADMVTTTTQVIADKYGTRGHAVVLPNYVPESLLNLARVKRDDQTRLGWTGTITTHPFDLQETRGQVGQVMKDTGAIFAMVGDPMGIRDALNISSETFVEATGWVVREIYYDAIAVGFDIGIVPLEQTKFNQAKSALKGIEMAALGIPFVSSRLTEYATLEKAGIGETARTARDWYNKLHRLVVNEDLRAETGARYKDLIAKSYTYEGNAEKWDTAWRRAILST